MKTKKELLARFLLPTLFLGVLGTAACSDEEVTPAERGPYDATEPKYVLANVELAFNRGDVNLLSNCLADDFVFYFDVYDTGKKVDGYTIPTSWTREEFLTAAGNLFAETYNILLTNHWRGIRTPARSETSHFADDVALEIVVMLDAINGYTLEDGMCDYESTREPAQKWYLYKWRERTLDCGGGG
ncbi:MAG: hypothetical protein V3W11_09740 [bacterium]